MRGCVVPPNGAILTTRSCDGVRRFSHRARGCMDGAVDWFRLARFTNNYKTTLKEAPMSRFTTPGAA
jgi:hypothetical protein